jgi:urocanate hydratase
MLWDVMGGVARRSWARNSNAMSTSAEFNRTHGEHGYQITIPYLVDDEIIKNTLK